MGTKTKELLYFLLGVLAVENNLGRENFRAFFNLCNGVKTPVQKNVEKEKKMKLQRSQRFCPVIVTVPSPFRPVTIPSPSRP
jgi:hypothetical protein